MNKILFIGKFSDETKELQSYLATYLSIQLCSDNVAIATSMLNMYGPDMVMLNLQGFDANHKALFQDIIANHSDLPVITLSTEEEKALFSEYFTSDQIHNITRPTSGAAVLAEITNYLDLELEMADEDILSSLDERKLILLVDDSPVILRGMKQMLDNKYRTMMATSGKQAMQAITREKPDLIFLDYEMPECDGKETLEMIRANDSTKDVPVVFLTGHGDADHIRSVLDLKPSAYFLKPPKAEKILEVLSQLL